jgi:Ribosomal protein L30E
LSFIRSAENYLKTVKQMDFNLSLRRAIKTGKVVLGQNSVEKVLGDAKLVIVAANAPAKVRESSHPRKTFRSTNLKEAPASLEKSAVATT